MLAVELAQDTVLSQRSSGVLLHITSLPGAHGCGDLGMEAYHFVDWLVAAGQRLWQILPLSPTGPGHSPYHSPSTFAGNPLLVDLDELVRCGWLAPRADEGFDSTRSDFDRVIPYRMERLHEAWGGFLTKVQKPEWAEFENYREQQAHWLQEYALFMALDERYGQPWTQWPTAFAQCDPQALLEVAQHMGSALGFFSFVQWRFSIQWKRLRAYAHARGVAIVGDAPIFVAHHSADVWANASQYHLDAQGAATVVAGVPPDYFSNTGQRWGNPLYRWDAMADDGFAWWIARIRHLLDRVDVVRLDHFRGFDSYWEIPADEPTAVAGRWQMGPGKTLFDGLAQALGGKGENYHSLIIAEDLGEVTPSVAALRHACGFPGMRVLQFAFGDTSANPYLPHNFEVQTVAYTGTHDNDTALGWWQSASDAERHAARCYLGPQVDTEIHWAMMLALSQSQAKTVVFPMQDILGLDGAHRMNTPGMAQGCWQWRFHWSQVQEVSTCRLADMVGAHGRSPPSPV